MKHINIPIFIPHLGCPNQCVFCNQRSISGVEKFNADDLVPTIEKALSTVDRDSEVEIAFFGGSFTGIDRALMISLLKIANGYISDGRVKSIRCSTRPDYINEEILDILSEYSVTTIELGLQSSSDDILKASKRGHNFEAELKSCQMIVNRGFNLIGQMMIGLPESDIESEIKTAEFIVSVGAVGARIYPTVVFKDTELCNMSISGEYTPLTLEEAISRSAAALEVFVRAGIPVIRIGLQSSENLSSPDAFFAGPNHSALGELVIGEYYYNKILKMLSDNNASENDNILVLVSSGALSKAVGQNRKNRIRLREKYKNISFGESCDIPTFGVQLDINNGEIKCI